MFEKASRMKLRFPYKGFCTAEDLWDLTVEELDSIFKGLNSQLKATEEESLIGTKVREDETPVLQVTIIRRVAEVKIAEAAAKVSAKEKAERKQKLLGILAAKQDSELQGKTAAEIEAMINEIS